MEQHRPSAARPPVGNSVSLPSYDDAGKLTRGERFDEEGNTIRVETFAYDANGNRIRTNTDIGADGSIDRIISYAYETR